MRHGWLRVTQSVFQLCHPEQGGLFNGMETSRPQSTMCEYCSKYTFTLVVQIATFASARGLTPLFESSIPIRVFDGVN